MLMLVKDPGALLAAARRARLTGDINSAEHLLNEVCACYRAARMPNNSTRYSKESRAVWWARETGRDREPLPDDTIRLLREFN